MSITEAEFEKARLSGLDFNPRCDCRLILYLFGRIFVVRQCGTPARWGANMACCSHQTLACPKHRCRTSFNRCPQCKQCVPLKLRWRRI